MTFCHPYFKVCREWCISNLRKLKQQIVGWVNYFRIAKMKTILLKIDERLRKRIRVIIWKQWKRTKKRYESLRKLGATHRNAYVTANCRKSCQYVCSTATIHTTITNKRLEQRGLTSLSNLYTKVHLAV